MTNVSEWLREGWPASGRGRRGQHERPTARPPHRSHLLPRPSGHPLSPDVTHGTSHKSLPLQFTRGRARPLQGCPRIPSLTAAQSSPLLVGGWRARVVGCLLPTFLDWGASLRSLGLALIQLLNPPPPLTPAKSTALVLGGATVGSAREQSTSLAQLPCSCLLCCAGPQIVSEACPELGMGDPFSSR